MRVTAIPTEAAAFSLERTDSIRRPVWLRLMLAIPMAIRQKTRMTSMAYRFRYSYGSRLIGPMLGGRTSNRSAFVRKEFEKTSEFSTTATPSVATARSTPRVRRQITPIIAASGTVAAIPHSAQTRNGRW